MNSRQIIIIAAVVLVIVVCVGAYFLFFANGNSGAGPTGTLPTATSSTTTASTTANPAVGQNFSSVSDEPILNYFVNSAGTVTAIEPTGKIVQVTNGTVTTLSSITIDNILSASFSYDGAKILVNFGPAASTQTSVFDVASKAWTPLAPGLQSPAWAPTGYKLAYATTNAAQGTESFGTIDISKAKPVTTALLSIHAADLAVSWPLSNDLAIYTKPSAYSAGSARIDPHRNRNAGSHHALERKYSGPTAGTRILHWRFHDWRIARPR